MLILLGNNQSRLHTTLIIKSRFTVEIKTICCNQTNQKIYNVSKPKYINIYYYELNCDMYENAAETESVTVSNIAQYYQIRYITTSRHQDV